MKTGDKNTKLGEYIRTRRLARGLDIRTVAGRSGFHPSYWRKLEAGHYASPDAKHLKTVAETIPCPLEDLYSLAGYTTVQELPTLRPYLRTKYDLPADAAAELERYFEYLRNYYGIPKDQRVFPAKSKPEQPKSREQAKHDRKRSPA